MPSALIRKRVRARLAVIGGKDDARESSEGEYVAPLSGSSPAVVAIGSPLGGCGSLVRASPLSES